ncbi:MAG: response regulator transcription factor [Gallionella sp.]|nr:response regulator transcription factor [Gallionella sp.]MCK9354254.1 response regulator transcription factor [Gallionella sp.]
MRLMLVDDHVLFREGMRLVLQQLPDVTEILEAGSFNEALRLAEDNPDLDLALMDLNMPGSDGPMSIRYFNQRYPHIPLMVVSGEESRSIMEKVMASGALGFVCKNSNAPLMLSALNLVLSGGVYVPPQLLRPSDDMSRQEVERVDRRSTRTNEFGLTARQMEVLHCIADGLSNKEIAERLNLAEGTVKIHVASTYQTLRVNNRMEAVRLAEQMGLIGAANG